MRLLFLVGIVLLLLMPVVLIGQVADSLDSIYIRSASSTTLHDSARCPFCDGAGWVPGIGNSFDQVFNVCPPPTKCSICEGKGWIKKNVLAAVMLKVKHHPIWIDWTTETKCDFCDGTKMCQDGQERAYEYLLRWRRGEEKL